MPTTTNHGTGRAPRTLAEKLQWLRELNTPRGEQPPSYDATARQITKETGISISGPYYWELVTGRTTNPKLHHLQAIARFFNVPVGYLSEDGSDFERLESALELLHTLRQRGTQRITLPGPPEVQADLTTLQTLIARLEMLGLPEDQATRERLSALGPREHATLQKVISDGAAVEALEDEVVRELVAIVADLTANQRFVLVSAARQPALLDALHMGDVQDIVLRVSSLSPTSQQAILGMIDHLRRVEQSKKPEFN